MRSGSGSAPDSLSNPRTAASRYFADTFVISSVCISFISPHPLNDAAESGVSVYTEIDRPRKISFPICLTEAGILTVEPVPYRIHAGGLRLLDRKEKAAFDELFARLSKPLKTAESAQRAWNACLAWYGVQGYRDELERILNTLKDTPRKGAAMLRNRVQCMQHRMHWTDGLTRIADDTIADADPELVALTEQYFHQELPQ